MRKILSLLLILALFLPCALAETPQGIDLALTSTYGDGLSLRMTAGLGETPFCSLTLPSRRTKGFACSRAVSGRNCWWKVIR